MGFWVPCKLDSLPLRVCPFITFRFSNSSQVDPYFDMKASRTRKQILPWMREPITFIKWLVSLVRMISLRRCCSTVDLHQNTLTQIVSVFPPSDKSTEWHATEWIQKGTFTHSLPLRYYSIEGQINMSGKLARWEDVKSTAEIVLRCLELNPNDRPTAAELLNDPWFLDVDWPQIFMCSVPDETKNRCCNDLAIYAF